MDYEVAVFVNEDGETVERLAMLIDGHDVQMLCYDGNSEAMLVKVDETVKQMPLRRVNRFITTRLLVGVLLLALVGCTSPYRQAQPAAIAISTASPYPTVQPSATVDYFNTAVVAQQTADEARRVNAIVTGQAEQRNLELYQLTAQAEQRDFAQKAWTVTAALTSIPLTATEQAAFNTKTTQQNSLIAGQLTATKEAPTQIVAMINSQNHARYAKVDFGLRIFVTLAVIGILGVLFNLLRLPQPAPATVQTEREEPEETVVQLKRETGNGDFSLTRMVIPCSPEQLTELAEGITSGEKTLAINQWEGAESGFTRNVILRVRTWLRQAQLAQEAESGQLVPNKDLLKLLHGWLDAQELPGGFDFETTPSPTFENG